MYQLQIMVTVENEWIRDLIIQLDGSKTLPQIADYLLENSSIDLFEEGDSDIDLQNKHERQL